MKLTQAQLKQIIKEELGAVLADHQSQETLEEAEGGLSGKVIAALMAAGLSIGMIHGLFSEEPGAAENRAAMMKDLAISKGAHNAAMQGNEAEYQRAQQLRK